MVCNKKFIEFWSTLKRLKNSNSQIKKKHVPKTKSSCCYCFVVPSNVAIIGSLNGIEGSYIALMCNYTESFPPADRITFVVDDQVVTEYFNTV